MVDEVKSTIGKTVPGPTDDPLLQSVMEGGRNVTESQGIVIDVK